MTYYNKKENIICYEKKELEKLFKASMSHKIERKLANLGIPMGALINNFQKIEQLIDGIIKRTAQDRDEHEIFFAIYVMSNFYDEEVNIGFKMKSGYNPERDNIHSMDDLISFRQIDTDYDFIIQTRDGFRMMQLKRYRGELSTESIFAFLKGKIKGYGNNLGDTNLLILIQPNKDFDVATLDLEQLNVNIQTLNLSFRGQIILAWNERNVNNLLVQIYPELRKKTIPFVLPSEKI